jgi:4-amino-4-deoxy-L-arabinose transferase-like glycosyltransferase
MSESGSTSGRRLILAVSAAFGLVAATLGVISGDQLRYPDERDYHELALNLLRHHAYVDEHFQPSACRPPGYPWVLASVYSLWQRPLAAKLLNASACVLTAIVLSLIASSIQKRISGLVAPVLALCFPLFAYTASTLYPQVLGTLFFAFAILCLVRPPAAAKGAIAAGLVFGFLVLMIPSFLLWLPMFPAYLLIADRLETGRRWLRRAALFTLCAVLVIAPWTARNSILLGSLIPVSTNSGVNLLLGNSPNTTPDSGVNVDISEHLRQTEGMNEVERDRFLKQCAVAWVKQNPGAALKLYLWKVANYFNFRNRLFTGSESSRWRDRIMFLTYYPFLLLAVVRLSLYRRFKLNLAEGFLFFLYFGNAFLSALFFTRIRFRIPFDALLIVLAAVFIGHLFSHVPPSAVKTPVAPLPRET